MSSEIKWLERDTKLQAMGYMSLLLGLGFVTFINVPTIQMLGGGISALSSYVAINGRLPFT